LEGLRFIRAGTSPIIEKSDSLVAFGRTKRTNEFCLINKMNSTFWDISSRSGRIIKTNEVHRSGLIEASFESENFRIKKHFDSKSNEEFYKINTRNSDLSFIDSLKIDVSENEQFCINATWVKLSKFSNTGAKKFEVQTPDPAECIKIDPSNTFFVSYTKSGIWEYRSTENGKVFLSAFLQPVNSNWVVWTPKGFYDCSTGGENLMGWSLKRDLDSLPAFYPASRFRKRFFRPDLIDSIFK
jgi:hypothetical protein